VNNDDSDGTINGGKYYQHSQEKTSDNKSENDSCEN
jgi:hypothetical protein